MKYCTLMVVTELRAKQTKQTIKPDYTTRTHCAHDLQTLLTDLPNVRHVGRLLPQKLRNNFFKKSIKKKFTEVH